MSTELLNGLEIISIVSIAACVLCPIFCWVLAHPSIAPQRIS
jgi:hypothetical protein